MDDDGRTTDGHILLKTKKYQVLCKLVLLRRSIRSFEKVCQIV